MATSLTSILQALRIMPTTADNKALSGTNGIIKHQAVLQQSVNGTLPSGLPEISLAEVAQHDDYNNCWIVIYDRVYDVTSFLRDHPGGEDVIMDHAGRDATLAFHGTGHSRDAIEQMRDYLIGELPLKERIFRVTHGQILSTGVPE